MTLNYTDNLIKWFQDYIHNILGVKCELIISESFNELVFLNSKRSFTFKFYNSLNLIDFNYVQNLSPDLKNIKLLKNDDLKLFIFSKEKNHFINKETDKRIEINYDLISLIIIIINRLEEYNYNSFEKHERFELKDSCLKNSNLYEYPIIDFWIEWISEILVSKDFKLKKANYNYSVSCDVDNIYRYDGVPLLRKIFNIFKDLIFDPNGLALYVQDKKKYLKDYDIHNKFDWMIKEFDKYQIKSTFNIIFSNTSFRYDYRYKLGRHVHHLINKIIENKHNIGIHYSYNCLKKKNLFNEWFKAQKMINKYGLSLISGRFHYLRIKMPDLLNEIEHTNQVFDETFTFHETGGFRCGTCKPYKPFNFASGNSSNITIIPLIIMEGSLLGYSNLDNKSLKLKINHYIQMCKFVNGCFTLLWHNSDLSDKNKKLFSYTLSKINL